MKKIEVSLVDLMRAVFQRWWVVVLCAVVGMGATYVIQTNQPQTAEEVVPYKEQLAKYEEDLEEYQTQTETLKETYEMWRESAAPFKKTRGEFLQYFQDSLLMRIDPYNAQKAFIQLSVVPEDDMATLKDELVPLLIEVIDNMSLVEALGDNYPEGIEESNLREIIQAKQVSVSIMTIQCYAVEDSNVNPQSIVDAIFQHIEKYLLKLGINKKIQKLNSGYANVSDLEFDMVKYERVRNFARYYDDYQRLSGQEAQSKDSYERYTKEKKPVKPSKPTQPQTNPTSNIDKQKLIIGAFAGASISIVLLVILYLFGLPVLHDKQVLRQLNIRYLGNIGKQNQQEENEQYRFICANLKRRDAENQHFLLLGNKVSLKELDSLASELNQTGADKGIAFIAGDNVFTTEKTIDMLNQHPDVVLVAKKNKSTIHSLNQEIERVEISLGKVVGYIFVNE